ncbi:MAG TPA: MBL fold metallo-hydrolase [Bacteroidota bacterium]|nr:MBL fold metallo-hydrolase [Bacteroidota bacterium]
MKVKFWGVRGSIPTPGKQTVRYGGNTPCLEIRLEDDSLIIFDAGTGIRNLGDDLINSGESVKAVLLITHPHWDHIQGFPFFKPAFISGNELTIVGTERPDKSLSEIIAEQMNRIYFPVRLQDLKATIKFVPVKEEGEISVFDAVAKFIYVNHPGFTVGYRLSHKGKSLVYISDNEPFDRSVAPSLASFETVVKEKFSAQTDDPNQRVIDFCRDADALIHDATYTPEEYIDRVGWGHSHYLFSLRVAAEANVKKLFLFHHDQNHSDEKVDDILKKCKKEIRSRGYRFECEAAIENAEFTV